MDNKNQHGDILVYVGRYEEQYLASSGKYKGQRYYLTIRPMTRKQQKEVKNAYRD